MREQMKAQDLLELYQLLRMYLVNHFTHADELYTIMDEVKQSYAIKTGGEDVRFASNPRNAGRKRRYTPESDSQVWSLRKEGKKYKEIAATIGCSVGHVQDVLKRQKYINRLT